MVDKKTNRRVFLLFIYYYFKQSLAASAQFIEEMVYLNKI
jgi:hypothetical protein